MAKKETINPITAFRKANEARKAVVMKSLKKAQEGIAQDTSAAQTLNKNTKPWEGKANLVNAFDPLRNQQMTNQQLAREAEMDNQNMDNQNNARMSARAASYEGPKSIPRKTDSRMVSDILNEYNKRIAEGKKLKGGSVKRKK